jgi:type IV pilus assembly protein PilF
MKKIITILLSSLLFISAYSHADNDSTNAKNRARIHTELGANYFSRGQYAIALDELREALSADNKYATAYGIMGLVYMDLKEDKPAEDNLKHALDLAPADSDIHNNYGWFLCTRARYDEAMTQFNISLANPLYDTPERALSNAGICSLKAGKPEQAQGYLERSLKFQPNQAQALSTLAQIYYQQGRYTETRVLVDRFFANNNPTTEALWLGVRLARKQGNKDSEASYALQLRRLFADAPETQLLLQGKFD